MQIIVSCIRKYLSNAQAAAGVLASAKALSSYLTSGQPKKASLRLLPFFFFFFPLLFFCWAYAFSDCSVLWLSISCLVLTAFVRLNCTYKLKTRRLPRAVLYSCCGNRWVSISLMQYPESWNLLSLKTVKYLWSEGYLNNYICKFLSSALENMMKFAGSGLLKE